MSASALRIDQNRRHLVCYVNGCADGFYDTEAVESAIGENILDGQGFGACVEVQPVSTTAISFLVIHGRIAVIETNGVETAAGIGVGATEAAISKAYAHDRVDAHVNRYQIRQVLVRPAQDDGHATRFLLNTATGGTTVERIKSGRCREVVGYDEGCA